MFGSTRILLFVVGVLVVATPAFLKGLEWGQNRSLATIKDLRLQIVRIERDALQRLNEAKKEHEEEINRFSEILENISTPDDIPGQRKLCKGDPNCTGSSDGQS